jgi:hypothetical protein
MNATCCPVEHTIDIALGLAEPAPADLEHRRFVRKPYRARIALLPVDAYGRHGVRLVAYTRDAGAAGFSAVGRRPFVPGSICAVLVSQEHAAPAVIGASVIRCEPNAYGGWELAFRFTDPPASVTLDDFCGPDGRLPMLWPPLARAA